MPRVREEFPPLSFDYALLDGRDALTKYDTSGPSSTRVFLTGIPKFDSFYASINQNEQVHALAICTNPVEPDARAQDLCAHLRAGFPDMRIVLRPHPADKRLAFWQDMAEEYRLSFSDSRVETAFEMFRGVDAVIAGESNVLLEAALMDLFAIYYDFSQAQIDYYGFVEQGLMEYTASPEAVEALVQDLRSHKPSVRFKAHTYCATIETAFDGRSAEVAAVLIHQILQSEIDWTPWQAVSTVQHLDAFELKRARRVQHAA